MYRAAPLHVPAPNDTGRLFLLMLLSITTTHRPATGLGHLLMKHTEKCQSFPLAFGEAHVFYPEASDERCTANLLLDLDPVSLVRGRSKNSEGPLAAYVNDRPYVASSFLSVAIRKVYGTAMKGRSKARPELVEQNLPLEVGLATLPSRGGTELIGELFSPLGYAVEAESLPLDETFPAWGDSPYYRVTLRNELRLAELLNYLYVLLPVLDDDKHYWVGDDEIEKLLAAGSGWLDQHPNKELIARRYLKHRRPLFSEALERLAEDEANPETAESAGEQKEEALEKPLSLNATRVEAVVETLRAAGAKRIVDVGCGDGKLLAALVEATGFERVHGMDVSIRALERAAKRLQLDRMPERKRNRIELFQGSLTYRDTRLADHDASCAVEVIEHIESSRLGAFEQGPVRARASLAGRRDDAQRRVQRPLRRPRRRRLPPRRSPLRMDAYRVRAVGDRCCGSQRLQRPFLWNRPRRPQHR